MPDGSTITRRGMLTATAVAFGGSHLATVGSPRVNTIAWSRPLTENGWPVRGSTPTTRVAGTELTVGLADGAATTILVHCLRRYFYEIDDTLTGRDILSHATDRVITERLESNHLSGTALAIRPDARPIGVSGGFTRRDQLVIRDILADCAGVVRWGGDTRPAKESHFQIDLPPTDPAVAGVAAVIEEWARRPGRGAGVEVEVTEPERLNRSRRLGERQAPR